MMTNAGDDLTVAQRQLNAGRLNEAEAACHNYLKTAPEHVEALQLLGTIQLKRGNFRDAATSLGRAICLRPEDAALHRHLGNVHFMAGNSHGSIDCYRQAIQLNPDDLETRNNLGVALRQAGKLDEAIETLQEVLRIRPDLPLPYKNLGETFHLQGKLEMAIAQYEIALRLDPRDATTHNSVGMILAIQGKQDAAISRFEEALKLHPEFAEVENNLANTLSAAGRFDEALTHASHALRLRPRFANAHVTLGNILKLQGNNERAVEEYKQALDVDPHNVVAHQSLGSVLTDLGRFDAAVIYLEEALRLEPNLFAAYQNLVALAVQDKYQFSNQQLDHIKALLENNNLPAAAASQLHFTMGSLLNKQGAYDAAMCSYQQANELQTNLLAAAGIAFDPHQFRKQIGELIERFPAAFFAANDRSGVDSAIPVFIVGMPRSGTTLVEQIIASHPQAAGAGELSDIASLAEELSISIGKDAATSECILHDHPEKLSALAQRYLDRLREIAPTAYRVVDKMPDNFLQLGLIALLFPNAHVIHCRRNAMDVCLSCYFSDFGAVRWAWQLQDIGCYHYEYERLMDHWRQVLPLQIYEIDYECLVADQETVSRELISFCGLDWNDQCLEFYQAGRAVQTLSRVQVRQPIYNTSIGRWKNYEKYLEPLITALQGKTSAD
jgi:tetratricopeptide (TPR) repeat protein